MENSFFSFLRETCLSHFNLQSYIKYPISAKNHSIFIHFWWKWALFCLFFHAKIMPRKFAYLAFFCTFANRWETVVSRHTNKFVCNLLTEIFYLRCCSRSIIRKYTFIILAHSQHCWWKWDIELGVESWELTAKTWNLKPETWNLKRQTAVSGWPMYSVA